jgi:hypothetical protein
VTWLTIAQGRPKSTKALISARGGPWPAVLSVGAEGPRTPDPLVAAGDEWASLVASRRRSLLGSLVESALNRPTNLLRPERFPDRRGRLVPRAAIPSPADPGLRADPVLGQRAPPQPPAQLDDRSGPVADLHRGGRPRPRTPGPRNRPRGWLIRHFSWGNCETITERDDRVTETAERRNDRAHPGESGPVVARSYGDQTWPTPSSAPCLA